MRTRQELLREIKTSKKVKLGAIAGLILSIVTYFYFDMRQVQAEMELMVLDQGKLDETVLE